MKYPIVLSRNGSKWSARQIKRADLSTGYIVYLFERETTPVILLDRPYVVAVKSPLDITCEWMTFSNSSRACQYYLNMLCCYA